jgi:hypothetical protein
MDKLTIVDVVTGEAHEGAVLPLTDELLDCLDAVDTTTSVTFDGTVDLDEPGALESAIADALDEAGPSTVYAVVMPADEDVGYVYTAHEDLPGDLESEDWVVIGTTAEDLAASIRKLV